MSAYSPLKNEATIDPTLQFELAKLGDAPESFTPEIDTKRFALFVDATARAKDAGVATPDLPDAVYGAYRRAEFFRDDPLKGYNNIQVPIEVGARINAFRAANVSAPKPILNFCDIFI